MALERALSPTALGVEKSAWRCDYELHFGGECGGWGQYCEDAAGAIAHIRILRQIVTKLQ
jgi:hypothetical protein